MSETQLRRLEAGLETITDSAIASCGPDRITIEGFGSETARGDLSSFPPLSDLFQGRHRLQDEAKVKLTIKLETHQGPARRDFAAICMAELAG